MTAVIGELEHTSCVASGKAIRCIGGRVRGRVGEHLTFALSTASAEIDCGGMATSGPGGQARIGLAATTWDGKRDGDFR